MKKPQNSLRNRTEEYLSNILQKENLEGIEVGQWLLDSVYRIAKENNDAKLLLQLYEHLEGKAVQKRDETETKKISESDVTQAEKQFDDNY